MLAPKRRHEDKQREDAAFFDYYAAFSHAFVERAFSRLDLMPGALVLDPWNGRGTTTTIAAELGMVAVGFDLNPAMVAVAEARLASPRLAEEALRRLRRRGPPTSFLNGRAHPIEGWLIPRAAADLLAVRSVLESIASSTGRSDKGGGTDSQAEKRRLRAFLLLSVASSLRSFMRRLQGSNPTWVREALPPNRRLRPSRDAIWATTLFSIERSIQRLPRKDFSKLGNLLLAQADSRALPLRANSVDAVITSPPYCTRIDYAVATRPELAIFENLDASSFRSLRDRLMGTTSIALRQSYGPPDDWGPICVATLTKIRAHRSKASGTYYYRNLLQYFAAFHASLQELDRVAKPKAVLTLVVQDSFYKDIHIDLAAILADMGQGFGWTLLHREDHKQIATLAALNPRAKVYRATSAAVESVLCFRKEGSA